MNLQAYATYYQQFLHKNYIITAGRKGKILEVSLSFQAEHFYHLLGLHKLADLRDIAKIGNKYLFYENVLRGQFSDLHLERSAYFAEAEERFACLMRLENLLQQNIVISFDPRKAYTAINAQLLLYEYFEQKYIHLFFTQSTRNQVFSPCSLFANQTTKYIYRQETYKILDIKVEEY